MTKSEKPKLVERLVTEVKEKIAHDFHKHAAHKHAPSVKKKLTPVFGARNTDKKLSVGPESKDVVFIGHQKFVKRTVSDTTAYFAEGMSEGAARTAVKGFSK